MERTETDFQSRLIVEHRLGFECVVTDYRANLSFSGILWHPSKATWSWKAYGPCSQRWTGICQIQRQEAGWLHKHDAFMAVQDPSKKWTLSLKEMKSESHWSDSFRTDGFKSIRIPSSQKGRLVVRNISFRGRRQEERTREKALCFLSNTGTIYTCPIVWVSNTNIHLHQPKPEPKE